ncbi:MAG: ABC transporter substrate-binding protein [Vulcanisaeta sp.]|nr:ABC transporter substrate-binding protein [Vulcanisaeta sp.]
MPGRGISKSVSIAIAVVIIVVIIGVMAYVLYKPPSKVSKPPTVTPTPPTTTTVAPPSNNTLVVAETTPPDSLDPAIAAYTQDMEILYSCYQTLVIFNGTDPSSFLPALAYNWTVSNNYLNWTFYIRQGAYFQNGDQINATTVWFSIYRSIVMNQFGAFNFLDLLYNGTVASITGYATPWGVCHAMEEVFGLQFPNPQTNLTGYEEECAYALANVLSNFNVHNQSIVELMEYPDQAAVVKGPYEIQFNLMAPYYDFLGVMAGSWAMIVDPTFVDQNGGVQPDQTTSYLSTHMLCSGPYILAQYIPGEEIVLTANPNYWAAKNPPNFMLTPAHIKNIVIKYYTSFDEEILALKTGAAQALDSSPHETPPPIYLSSILAIPNLVMYGPVWSGGDVFLVFDTQRYPYNLTVVREAFAYAINTTQIIDTVLKGFGAPFLGPIPPYPPNPYYNPGNLPPYPYDPNKAIELLASAGFQLTLPNGTVINPNGKPLVVHLWYISTDLTFTQEAQMVQQMLSNIGVQVILEGVPVSYLVSAMENPPTSPQYPGFFLLDWYPDWWDPVAQEAWFILNVDFGGIAGNEAWYNNSLVNTLTTEAVFTTNITQRVEMMKQVYAQAYKDVPYIWLYEPAFYGFTYKYVCGVLINPLITGFYYPTMYFYNGTGTCVNYSPIYTTTG